MHAKSYVLESGATLLLLCSLAIGCGDSDSGQGGGASGGAPTGGSASGGSGRGGNTGVGGSTASAANGNGNAGDDTAGGEPGASATLAVDLGSASDYVILAKSGISTVPTSAITGNLGVSPATASAITGFSLIADSTNVFATSRQVTGRIFAANYAAPTPANMTTAVSDMELAFTDAAGRPADVTELGAGSIGGMTLTPGVYQWGTGLLIPTDVTLRGNGNAVWIFQIAADLTLSSAARIVLSGGAQSKNIFWQVSGRVALGTTAHLEGVVLTQTAIALRTGASVNGRLLAQTAVSLDSNALVEPAE